VGLLLLGKGAVLAHVFGRPFAVEMDDEEQPARHGSALAADRRRGRNSIANVALLRLPRCDSAGRRRPTALLSAVNALTRDGRPQSLQRACGRRRV
jgi:hypothetical protein